MSNARIRMQATAKKGEVVEIKTLISHVMETGQRRDADEQGDRAQDPQQIRLQL